MGEGSGLSSPLGWAYQLLFSIYPVSLSATNNQSNAPKKERKKKKAGARYYFTKSLKDPKVLGYWKNCGTRGIWNSPGRGSPATKRLVFNYLETGVHSWKHSQWTLTAPRVGLFPEQGGHYLLCPWADTGFWPGLSLVMLPGSDRDSVESQGGLLHSRLRNMFSWQASHCFVLNSRYAKALRT